VLYTLVDWQRRLLDPWLIGLRLGAGLPLWQRGLSAQHALIERTLQAGTGDPVPIEAAVARDHPGVTSAVTVDEGPFSRLVRLRGAKAGPPIFVVAPYSGYAGAVLGELAAALLPAGEVYFLDWADARNVPMACGCFGVEEQLAVVLAALRTIPAPAHLVGVSQSGAVTLAAAALATAAADSFAPPRSLSLLGAPIGASKRRATADWLLASLGDAGLEASLIAVVPERYPGAGRKVYPGLFQLIGLFMTDPGSYFETQAGLWAELVNEAPGIYDRLHGDLHRVADVPAELFTQTIDQLLQRPPLSPEGLAIGARAIPEAGLARLPILTIEAGRDELVGAGAGHAAQALGGPGSQATTIDGAAHYALFRGPAFTDRVARHLRQFITEHG
jgi:poly(3-hydroxybutyrate) depolymerase